MKIIERIGYFMSFSKINSMGLIGLDGYLVEVQTDISNGLPAYEIVGLPDTAVREAKERVRAAIKNIGATFPTKRIVINLAPANYRKEGVIYDLPIAIAILEATEQLLVKNSEETAFLGELSLDGQLNPVTGVLPMTISAYQKGIKNIFVPYENASEASVIDGINVFPVKTLADVIKHFSEEQPILPYKTNTSELFSAINSSSTNRDATPRAEAKLDLLYISYFSLKAFVEQRRFNDSSKGIKFPICEFSIPSESGCICSIVNSLIKSFMSCGSWTV